MKSKRNLEMKATICIFMFICLLSSSLTLFLPQAANGQTIKGDIDDDGKIDLKETIYSLQVIAGLQPVINANHLIGSWMGGQAGENNNLAVLTFIDETHYVVIQDGDSAQDPSGQDGMEIGTYTWNPVTGDFAAQAVIDNNGEWGFSSLSQSATISINGNILTLNDNGDVFTATKIQ